VFIEMSIVVEAVIITLALVRSIPKAQELFHQFKNYQTEEIEALKHHFDVDQLIFRSSLESLLQEQNLDLVLANPKALQEALEASLGNKNKKLLQVLQTHIESIEGRLKELAAYFKRKVTDATFCSLE
jgi:hypothetical protein